MCLIKVNNLIENEYDLAYKKSGRNVDSGKEHFVPQRWRWSWSAFEMKFLIILRVVDNDMFVMR